MKKTWMCLAAIGGLAMLASSAYAADKTLALVVKGLRQPATQKTAESAEQPSETDVDG